MINTKSRSGQTISWKKYNEYYYQYTPFLGGTSVKVYKMAIGECSKNRKMKAHERQEFKIGRQK